AYKRLSGGSSSCTKLARRPRKKQRSMSARRPSGPMDTIRRALSIHDTLLFLGAGFALGVSSRALRTLMEAVWAAGEAAQVRQLIELVVQSRSFSALELELPLDLAMRVDDSALRTVHAMRAKSTSELETLESNIAKLTAQQAESLTELQFSVANCDSLSAKLEAAMDRLAGAIRGHTHTALAIQKAIHPGTRIWVRGYRIEFEDTFNGPVLITLDENGEPQHAPLKGDGNPRALREVATVVSDDTLPRLPKADATQPTPLAAAGDETPGDATESAPGVRDAA
ncbi:MAG: hypothetical protein AAF411_31185, partial [Myxococcota bacterium]